jgi:hypothetical protein
MRDVVLYTLMSLDGRKLFEEDKMLTKLHLLGAKATSSGGLLLDYEVQR